MCNTIQRLGHIVAQNNGVTLVGPVIRYFRLARGYTVEDVARETGLGKSYLKRVEAGENIPPYVIKRAIADALELDVAALDHVDVLDSIAVSAGIDMVIATAIFEEIMDVVPVFEVGDLDSPRIMRQKLIDVLVHKNTHG